LTLVILSAFLSQEEKSSVISAAGETPTLVLDGLTFPRELLAQVERMLLDTSQEAKSAGLASHENRGIHGD
jgi:hypothetical protein